MNGRQENGASRRTLQLPECLSAEDARPAFPIGLRCQELASRPRFVQNPPMALAVILLLSLASLAVWGACIVAGFRAEPDAPTCGRCGYNLTGAPSNRCPECGGLFVEVGVHVESPPRKRAWRWCGLGMQVFAMFMLVLLLGLSFYRAGFGAGVISGSRGGAAASSNSPPTTERAP